MQRRMRRPVRRVGDVVRLASGEAVLRMEARDLDHAFEVERDDAASAISRKSL